MTDKKEFIMNISKLESEEEPKSYMTKITKKEERIEITDEESEVNNDLQQAFRILKRKSGGNISKREKELKDFADAIKSQQKRIGEKRKVSSRGWCYLLEGFNLITKDRFNQCTKIINECRKKGFLPIDFVLKDTTRQFHFVEDLEIDTENPHDYLKRRLKELKDNIISEKEDISFWDGSEFYIQLIVEKVDLLHLFANVCKVCHIPIANVKGWSDILSRYELATKFKKAEELEMKPVLLYYCDHDPDGLFIVDTIKKNLEDVSLSSEWHTNNLIIDRIGLKYEFIREHNLTWIDNLTTGSGRQADQPDKYGKIKPHVAKYIKEFGHRKCEANAILPYSQEAILDCVKQIRKYIPNEIFEKYKERLNEIREEVISVQVNVDFDDIIDKLVESIKKEKND